MEKGTEFRDNGDIHWTIKEINPLYEVSCCTFPAYESTNIDARTRQRDDILKRKNEAWRKTMKGRLKNGTQSIDD